MNPDDEKLRALLNDLLPTAAGEYGPARAQVLEMARHERSRRRRARVIVKGFTAATFLLAGIASWCFRPTPSLAPIATASDSQPVLIQSVDDDELFALLQSTPSALMEWPNGERTLLVVLDP
jgi:hypothetical protein